MTTLDLRPPRTDDGDPALEMTPGEILAELAKRPLGGVGPNVAAIYDALWHCAEYPHQWCEAVWIDTDPDYGDRMASLTTWAVIRHGIDVDRDGRVRLSDLDPLLAEAVEDYCCERRDLDESVPDVVNVDTVAMVWLGIDERALAAFARCHEFDDLVFAVAEFFGPSPVPVRPDLLVHWRSPLGAACRETDEPRMTGDPRLVTCEACLPLLRAGSARLVTGLAISQLVGGAR